MENDEDTISIIWHIEDVQQVADNNYNIDLTDEQAREVLYSLKKYHNAEVGINWDVIDVRVGMYINEEGLESEDTDE